jgi:hypothetical protein
MQCRAVTCQHWFARSTSYKKATRLGGLPETAKVGGARRDRTADLVNAIHALSHLSYGPDS